MILDSGILVSFFLGVSVPIIVSIVGKLKMKKKLMKKKEVKDNYNWERPQGFIDRNKR